MSVASIELDYSDIVNRIDIFIETEWLFKFDILEIKQVLKRAQLTCEQIQKFVQKLPIYYEPDEIIEILHFINYQETYDRRQLQNTFRIISENIKIPTLLQSFQSIKVNYKTSLLISTSQHISFEMEETESKMIPSSLKDRIVPQKIHFISCEKELLHFKECYDTYIVLLRVAYMKDGDERKKCINVLVNSKITDKIVEILKNYIIDPYFLKFLLEYFKIQVNLFDIYDLWLEDDIEMFYLLYSYKYTSFVQKAEIIILQLIKHSCLNILRFIIFNYQKVEEKIQSAIKMLQEPLPPLIDNYLFKDLYKKDLEILKCKGTILCDQLFPYSRPLNLKYKLLSYIVIETRYGHFDSVFAALNELNTDEIISCLMDLVRFSQYDAIKAIFDYRFDHRLMTYREKMDIHVIAKEIGCKDTYTLLRKYFDLPNGKPIITKRGSALGVFVSGDKHTLDLARFFAEKSNMNYSLLTYVFHFNFDLFKDFAIDHEYNQKIVDRDEYTFMQSCYYSFPLSNHPNSFSTVDPIDVLFVAINGNQSEYVFELAKMLNFNTLNCYGNAPLHAACKFGRYKMVQILVNAGADIYIKNRSGYMPIHFAIVEGYLDIVQFFIDRDAKLKSIIYEDFWRQHAHPRLRNYINQNQKINL